jgi:hypothetical protein
VHLYHSIADSVIVASLDTAEKLDSNPFFFALHESCHDFPDPIFIEALWLDVVDILLVILSHLLFPGSLGDCRIPSIAIINAKSFNGCMG